MAVIDQVKSGRSTSSSYARVNFNPSNGLFLMLLYYIGM